RQARSNGPLTLNWGGVRDFGPGPSALPQPKTGARIFDVRHESDIQCEFGAPVPAGRVLCAGRGDGVYRHLGGHPDPVRHHERHGRHDRPVPGWRHFPSPAVVGERPLEAADRIALERKLASTQLGDHIVVLQIWGLDGRLIFNSADPSLATGPGLAKRPPASAFAGEVSSRIVDPSELESVFKERKPTRLIETYSPIRADRNRSVIAVADFYQAADDMEQAVRAAQLRSWVVHGAVTLAMLALLATLVRRATNTIAAQQRELGEKVDQLTALLAQNEQLHDRVRRAGARTT